MVKTVRFRSKLHKSVYERASDCVLRLKESHVKALKASIAKPISINKVKFQLVEIDSDFFIFKLSGSSLKTDIRVEGEQFYIGKDKFVVKDLDEEDELKPEAPIEHIDVSKLKGKTVKKVNKKEKVFEKETFNPSNDDFEFNFSEFINLERPSGFWFSLNYDFRNTTEEFWRELESYYRYSPEKLKVLVNSEELTPIFSKRDDSLNNSSLHESIVSKISERINELEENKLNLEKQLLDLESDLIKLGADPSKDSKFSELTSERKSISECLLRVRNSLDKYSNQLQKLGEVSSNVRDRFLIDVDGKPQQVLKYYEKVLGKLIDLNLEINSIHRYHHEIEHVLIKRLKEANDLKDIEDRVREIERDEILKDYEENNRESLSNWDNRESLKCLGNLQESVSEINKRIESEKSKIRYYLDNLKDIDKYDNFELSLVEHKRKKRQIRKDTLNFRKKLFDLKYLLFRREQKRDDFSKWVLDSVVSLKKEVVDTCKSHDNLVDNCVSKWKDRWQNEAKQEIEGVYSRSEQIIESFSLLPPTQIMRIYKFQKKLKDESMYRQQEWDRIYDHVKQEFQDLGYKREYPNPSEFDSKYLDMIDSSDVKMSAITEKVLFVPTDRFSLSMNKDLTIGLDPKVLDDDNYVVIDQVWSTLTPEQEKIAQERLMRDQMYEKSQRIQAHREDLVNNQLNKIKNRFETKYDSVPKTSREFTDTENFEKFKGIEESELKLWKEDNYLISNTKGEFRDILYRITKKLFSTRSVRIVDNKMEFTNDGFVRDGGAEIFSAKDYFLKMPESNLISGHSEDLDLNSGEDIHSEPDEKFLELLSDSQHLGNVSDFQNKGEAPRSPTVLEWAHISIKKFREEKSRGYELDLLKEKLLELDDEIKRVKTYHEKVSESLDKAVSERWEVFEDMKTDIDQAKSFLSDKDSELSGIFASSEQNLNAKLKELEEDIKAKRELASKINTPKKQGFIYWFNRLWHGEKIDEEEKLEE